MMKQAFAWLALLAASPGAVSAAPTASSAPSRSAGVEDPRAFVAAHYEAYRRDPQAVPVDPVQAYSPRLRRLFDDYALWTDRHEDLVGSLDFDWWTNSQDWRIDDVALDEEAGGPDRRTIVARFRNWGEPALVRFAFVREAGRWFLDDASSGEGEEGWVLSELLRERPASSEPEARGVDDPRAFVAARYEEYRRGPDAAVPADPVFAYSPRLRALFDDHARWAATQDDLAGAIGFDWWTSAQDWEITAVELAEQAQGDDRRLVAARFRNFGEPGEVRFSFVREGGRWYLDDAASGEGEEGWVLSDILRER